MAKKKTLNDITPAEWDSLNTQLKNDIKFGDSWDSGDGKTHWDPLEEHRALSEGKKNDSGKVRLELIPPAAIWGLGRALTHGASKYGPNNWQGVGVDRYKGALLRHLTALLDGEHTDPDSGLPHTDHILANAAFLSHFDSEGKL